MKRLLVLLLALAMLPMAHAGQGYDDTANAVADLKAARKLAAEQHRRVIVIFGADWCPYCRSLARALDGEAGIKLAQHFVIVKVNVGQWDRNMDLVESYGDPLGRGLPGASVIDASDRAIFVARADALVNAVDQGRDGLSNLFRNAAE